ncbi:MAG TPA: type II toxin-antitoxin system VapB family antitoxin [Acidimicrobiales bacterium]|nr:type II toxin-antitoxin system VapB family antitoxin [Acidimicrobiales bacterium]
MALNIKSPDADRLAREVASLTNESLTQAVIKSLEERLARVRSKAGTMTTAQRLRRLADEYAGYPVADDRSAEELLGYDENGLPT